MSLLSEIAERVARQGGKAYYAGGCVRDYLCGINMADLKDLDIEVFGLEAEEVLSLLNQFAEAQWVGKSFPVIKLKGYPRWDFTVPDHPDMPLEEACRRRDFTMNAILSDILSGEVFDFFNGRKDLQNRILRQTGPEVFGQDPLRAYRACQLAARMDLTIEPLTFKAMAELDIGQLAPERVFEELRKMLLLSEHPSIGLRYMEKSGLLQKVHPDLYALIGCEQSPTHHPEGDVWEHTLLVVDEAAKRKNLSSDPEVYMFAALLHDIAKPQVTRREKEKVTAYGHDTEGARLARQFLERWRAPRRLTDAVVVLVREHMRPVLLYKQRERITDKAIRKLVSRVNLSELLLLSEADYYGRTLERDYTPIREWMIDYAEKLGLEMDGGFKALIQGRDLLAMGIPPGKAYADILARAYEWQLEGLAREDILERLQLDIE